ncbi:serine/threonine-protein kinase Nek3 isoform X2 [Engraulis encrasicolus]|uniref:serine/threonine-protein kinase Nek3 isoform X2 n=1 Tax=Engraulis encrasicolus TaxID=184585 RepID=UPI002FD4039D
MDGYRILKEIGEGSFGRALLVQPKGGGESTWVLKEIQLPKARSGVEQSRREAVLLSKMNHPNIVAFKDSFEADGHLYIAMEFCGGGDLMQRIRQQKNVHFSADSILRWFAQMCSGAQHIHDKRVLHRDLKSKNIFLTDNGTVKLGDFGSACVLSSAKGYAQTYVGTPYYVSPEIWDNKPYNNKSDVWSLGCVLYELCTLRHPFQARSWKSLILKVCRGSYEPLPRHLPYELHYLIKHMFKTNPRDRPSMQTILTSHRIARLLLKHLPPQQPQSERAPQAEQVPHAVSERAPHAKRAHGWRREEGEAVAELLGQKTLLTSSTVEGAFADASESLEGEAGPRRRWAAVPSETVLRVLGDADVISTESMPIGGLQDSSESEQKGERRRWAREPPERLLSLLEKANLCNASDTYTIHKKGEGPALGPLSDGQDDAVDGPEDEDIIDDSRMDPRSDDEDTDFEEEAHFDLLDGLEEMTKH